MLKLFLAGCFSLLAASAISQTLFTYGTDSVSVPVFLQAYQKNNTGPKNAKALREYLDLYIASRLKIREAKARGYDTLPQISSDLASLRAQIVPAYLNDAASVDRLVQEAFDRSQKDVHVAHIFIPASGTDTAAAWKKAEAAIAAAATADFATVAKQYSADPLVQQDGGDMGFMTAFTLPYAIENIVYGLPPGAVSRPFRSPAGYHIFKNQGERKAAGRMKAAQILLAFPPAATAAEKSRIASLADSLYHRIAQGDDFGKLALQFSNDLFSANAQGQMQEFGVGEYDAVFEKQVYGLQDGGVSKPFATPYGYHIVKRITGVPVPRTADEKTREQLRAQVQQSDRIKSITDALVQKVLQDRFQPAAFSQPDLFLYTDSLLDDRKAGRPLRIEPGTRLFAIGQDPFTAADWITFAQSNRLREDGSGAKSNSELWDEYIKYAALEYYQDHLEAYSPAFRQQLDEFRDGNLFFEIMQQEVWNRAQRDTAALQDYYNRNRKRYVWKSSADAVVFYVSDMETAKTFREQLLQAPARWRDLVSHENEKIAADSNRFEVAQLPNPAKQALKPGVVTATLLNSSDNTVSFAYILKLYPQTAQRTFAEAKGLVVNDYQAALEKQWLAELKKKYPVVVNQKELGKLMR